MIDNGIYTFNDDQYKSFIKIEPNSKKLFRKFLGGDEFINGFYRWILYLRDLDAKTIRSLPHVYDRVRQVRNYRASSSRLQTVKMAEKPTFLGVDERLARDFLVVPNTSSERRFYVPIGYVSPGVIANQKLRILPDATPSAFGMLTSAMHMAWMRAITGRLESRYMYSVGVVYNTFPWPYMSLSQELKVGELAQTVLDARTAHPGSTLADLYDPDLMPPNLRKAHHALDLAVDKLYRKQPFASERERVEHLFGLYEKMVAPIEAAAKAKPKRAAKKAPIAT